MANGEPALRIFLEGREVTVPAGEVITVGRDPASTVVTTNPTVSRRHALLRVEGGAWQFEDVGSTGGTWFGGQRVERLSVASALEVRLGDREHGEVLRLRPARTEVPANQPVPGDVAPGEPTGPVPAPGGAFSPGPVVTDPAAGRPPPGGVIRCAQCGRLHASGTAWCSCGAYLPFGSEVVTEHRGTGVALRLLGSGVTVDPGGDASCEVEVRNTGVLVDRFELRVEGPSATWAVAEPGTLSFLPGDSGVATVRFRPPREPHVAPGTTVFSVVAVSQVDAKVSATEQGTLTVTPFATLGAQLAPTTSRGSRGATHLLVLDNGGNVPLAVALEAQDQAGLLAFRLPAMVEVPPGERAKVSVEVTPRTPITEGPSQARPFQVVATAGDDLAARVDGTLFQEPDEPPPALLGRPSPAEAPASGPAPPPKPRRWSFEVHPVAVVGAVLAAVAATLSWFAGGGGGDRSAFDVPARFLFAGNLGGGGGISTGTVLVLGGLVASALSFLPKTVGLRRLLGLTAVAAAGAFAGQLAWGTDARGAGDVLSALGPGPYVALLGGVLLILSA